MIFMENVCLYCDPSVAHDFSQACISTHLELMQFHRHTLWLRSSLSVTEGIIFFEAGEVAEKPVYPAGSLVMALGVFVL